MVRVLGWFGSGAVFLILAACAETPVTAESLDFATDPRILRGVWEGESDVSETLRLEARASDPTAEGYTVSGTFSLGYGEPVAFRVVFMFP